MFLLAVDERGKREEGLFNGFSGDCAGLDEVNALGFAPTMDFFQRHQLHLIFFIAQQEITGVGHSLKGHLVPYILHALPATRIAHVQHHHHAFAGLEVSRHDRSEFLLPSSVPNAEFDFSLMEADGLVSVIYGGEWMF